MIHTRHAKNPRPLSAYPIEHLERLPAPQKVWECVPDNVPEAESSIQLKHPTDVAFIDQECFVMADSAAHRLVIVNLESNTYSTIAEGKIWPNNVTVTPDSKIIVSDRRDKMVKVYDTRGDCLQTFGDPELLTRPHGVAMNSKGDIIVADTASHSMHVYNKMGKLRYQFGSRGPELKNLCLPFYCCVDRRDNIIVSDNMNYSVKLYDRYGNFYKKIGSGHDWGDERMFQCPYGVCIDLEGNILVADYDSHRIFMYTHDGSFIKHLLTKMNRCFNPMGIAMGPCGNLVYTEMRPRMANVKAYAIYNMVDNFSGLETTI